MPGSISSYARILMLLKTSRLQETKVMHMEGASVRNENNPHCLREAIKVQWYQHSREQHTAY